MKKEEIKKFIDSCNTEELEKLSENIGNIEMHRNYETESSEIRKIRESMCGNKYYKHIQQNSYDREKVVTYIMVCDEFEPITHPMGNSLIKENVVIRYRYKKETIFDEMCVDFETVGQKEIGTNYLFHGTKLKDCVREISEKQFQEIFKIASDYDDIKTKRLELERSLNPHIIE